MKKLMVLCVLLLVGCSTGNRQELVTRFKNAYPDTWQKELLEYDVEQGNTNQARHRHFWNTIAEFFEKQSENEMRMREARTRQPRIIGGGRENNSTYYQEKEARKRLYGY